MGKSLIVSTRIINSAIISLFSHLKAMSNNSQADQVIDWSRNFTLGILGGGQLGKMLLDETARVDIKTAVLEPSPDAPAAARAN